MLQRFNPALFRCRHQVIAGISKTRNFSTVADLNETILQRIKKLQQSSNNNNLALRLCVEGGGCSGFQYVFKMVDINSKESDDKIFQRDDAKLLIDSCSLDLVKGATVDYQQEMIRSSFAVVNNPQSESACGCGSSFAVKNFAAAPAID